MKLLLCLSVLLCGSFSLGSQEIPNNSPLEVGNGGDTGVAKTDQGSARDGKFFPVVKVVSFENTPCETDSGLVGTCYSDKECAGIGGEYSGECAKGYGVCCVITALCDDHIKINNTYFQSSDYSHMGMCMVQLYPPHGTVQLKLEFVTFDILGPVEGDCGNDTFIVTGINPGTQIPILCGTNTGKHIFVDVDNAHGPTKLIFATSGIQYSRKWNIRVSFLTDYDPCKAPPRCLEYHTDISGTISSFNYGLQGQSLNDLAYSICFGYVSGYCDIGLSFTNLDFGVLDGEICIDDYVGVTGTQICGTLTDFTIQVNVTGPIILYVVSDGDNSLLQQGFLGSYMYMPCNSLISNTYSSHGGGSTGYGR